MKLMITPEEIIQMTFAGRTGIAGSITPSCIYGCQLRHIKPVVNNLYEPLLNGAYETLLENYIKPSLAIYTKASLLQHFNVSAGSRGLTKLSTENMTAAESSDILALKRQLHLEGRTILMQLTEYIEKNTDRYPEYRKSGNVLNRTRIISDLIL